MTSMLQKQQSAPTEAAVTITPPVFTLRRNRKIIRSTPHHLYHKPSSSCDSTATTTTTNPWSAGSSTFSQENSHATNRTAPIPTTNDQKSSTPVPKNTPDTNNSNKTAYHQFLLHPRQDRATILAAVAHSGSCLSDASDSLRDDPVVVRTACTHQPWVWQWASERLRDDKAFVLSCYYPSSTCTTNCTIPLSLSHMSDRLRRDPDVIRAALLHDGRALQYARLDRAPHHNDDDAQQHRALVLLACNTTGTALAVADPHWRSDAGVVEMACRTHGAALGLASAKVRDTASVVLVACRNYGSALQWASDRVRRTHRDIVETACRRFGRALQYAGDAWQDDVQVVTIACGSDGRALQYASERVRKILEVVLVACTNDSTAIQYAGDALRNRTDVVCAALEACGRNILMGSRLSAAYETIQVAHPGVQSKIMQFKQLLYVAAKPFCHLDKKDPAALATYLQERAAFRSVFFHLMARGISAAVSTLDTHVNHESRQPQQDQEQQDEQEVTPTRVTVPHMLMLHIAGFAGVPMGEELTELRLAHDILPLATTYGKAINAGTWASMFKANLFSFPIRA